MTKKQQAVRQQELCELYVEAINNLNSYFRNKRKALEKKKIQKKAEPE